MIDASKTSVTKKNKKLGSIERAISGWIKQKLQSTIELKRARKRLMKRTKAKLDIFVTKSLQNHVHNVAGCLNELRTSDSMSLLKNSMLIAKQNQQNIEKMIQKCDSFISQDNLH